MITISIHDLGNGQCALTGKTEQDCVQVAFGTEAPVFLSKKAFWQLLSMRVKQSKQPDPKPTQPEQKPVARPATPTALPANGPVPVAAMK